MKKLSELLQYENICIQCHDNPDADTIASAYGLYCFFTSRNIAAKIIYSGIVRIKKYAVSHMIEECRIPIEHVDTTPDCDLLILTDCQYESGNVTVNCPNVRPVIAQIDHHLPVCNSVENSYIDDSYQSCSTIIWELLRLEGVVSAHFPMLDTALAYGLCTDTSMYADLKNPADMNMKAQLRADSNLLMELEKSNIKAVELMLIGDALNNCDFDIQSGIIFLPVFNGEPYLLAIIADLALQVEQVKLCIAYTKKNDLYPICVRSCVDIINAAEIVQTICRDMGTGGGHRLKAAGRIDMKKMDNLYPGKDISAVIKERINFY